MRGAARKGGPYRDEIAKHGPKPPLSRRLCILSGMAIGIVTPSAAVALVQLTPINIGDVIRDSFPLVSVLGMIAGGIVGGVIALRSAMAPDQRDRCGQVLCVECGRNLTGNVLGVCPECGTARSAEERPRG